jgi:uncharacterized DUF497 family protein
VYYLTGVLMHVGPDANHGHYIAHIQELETGNWFKFSDEYVVPLDKKTRLNIRPAEEETVKKCRMSRPNEAGGQNSNNAYMLVYMLRSSIEEIRRVELREAVKRDAVRRSAIHKLAVVQGTAVTVLPEDGLPEKEQRDPAVRGVKRKNSGDSSGSSVEEVDYSDEYCYSNSRVFPVTFQPHLRTKIDKDNQEFDEELEEKKHVRLVSVRNNNKKRLKMMDLYKGWFVCIRV